MAAFADDKIEAYLGPQELGAADNLEDVIVDFIRAAKVSLSIAVQEIDNLAIAEAILDARWRGVKVEVFLEQDYLRTMMRKVPAAPAPRQGETPEQAMRRVQWAEEREGLRENRRILSALLRNGIEVHGDFNPALFHQKFVLRDYGARSRPTTALLTGSANFTTTDTHRNLNHVFVFHNSDVCRQYAGEFEQIRGGSFGRGAHGKVPKVYSIAGVPVKVLFAPDHTPELEIMKQVLTGKNAIHFAIFTFAGSSGIDDAILAVARAGVKVKGVLDPGQARQKWAASRWLVHPNIELYVPQKVGVFADLRKVHHKLMVVDDHTVIAGSFNYTAPANDYNDENIFVLGSVHAEVEGRVVDGAKCRDLATLMRVEIERIIAGSARYEPPR